jgi:hypothetical protein
MFNFLSHKENANQNITEVPSHSNQNSYHQENKQQRPGAVAQVVEHLPSSTD